MRKQVLCGILGCAMAALTSFGAAPRVVSVTPAPGATGVSVTSDLVFTFDQPMNTAVILFASFPPFLVGNFEVQPSGLMFTGTWSGDGRTLTCEPVGPMPANATITWVLNPTGTQLAFSNQAGEAAQRATGTFSTGEGEGEEPGCDDDGVPEHWGGYSVNKAYRYVQTGPSTLVPETDLAFAFSVFLTGPDNGPNVTAGSIAGPGGAVQNLQGVFGGSYFLSQPAATETALDQAYPGGGYTLRFTQAGQPERVIPMTMPAPGGAQPQVANFAETQAIVAAQAFTLRWNEFTDYAEGSSVSLQIMDAEGELVFAAPDLCIPTELAPNATSIVIPGGTLPDNQELDLTLSFNRMFYFSTNAVAEMSGFGGVIRSTNLKIRTGTGGGGPADPARFTGYRMLPNGRPSMDLAGTVGKTYKVERTTGLGTPTWLEVGRVTMDTVGEGVFEDGQPGLVPPVFYRAVAD